MSSSPSDPDPADAAPSDDAVKEASVSAPGMTAGQRSRVGTVWLGGYFDPAVVHALKTLALQQGTTVQALIGRALNDLLERAGHGRPASEAVLPRGGAAHRRGERRRS